MIYIGVTRRPESRFTDAFDGKRHSDRYDGMVLLKLTQDPAVARAVETELIDFIRKWLPGCMPTNVGNGGERIPQQLRDLDDSTCFFIYATFSKVLRL